MRYWLAVVLAASACGRSDHNAAPAPASSGSQAAAPAAPPDALGPGLTVTEPGAEPRAMLEHALPAVLDRDLHVRLVDTEHPNAAAVADMRYHVHCAPCTYSLTSMGDPTMPDELKKDMAALAKQVHGTLEVPKDGAIVGHPDTLMKTTPSTTELFKLLVIRFPAQPVGVGAQWTVVDGPVTTSYELIERTEAGAKLQIRSYAAVASETVDARGVLSARFADPFATGTMTELQTVTAPASAHMPPMKLRSMMTIE